MFVTLLSTPSTVPQWRREWLASHARSAVSPVLSVLFALAGTPRPGLVSAAVRKSKPRFVTSQGTGHMAGLPRAGQLLGNDNTSRPERAAGALEELHLHPTDLDHEADLRPQSPHAQHVGERPLHPVLAQQIGASEVRQGSAYGAVPSVRVLVV